MTIVRWEPFRELSSLQTEMNRLFNAAFDAPAGNGGARRWTPGDGPRRDRGALRPARRPARPDRGRRQHRARGQRAHRLRRAQGRARGQARGLLPRRARVRLVLPLADAAEGRSTPRPSRRAFDQRRARGARPQARAAQAAQDQRSARAATSRARSRAPRRSRAPTAREPAAPQRARAGEPAAARGSPREPAAAGSSRYVRALGALVRDPHARPRLARPHRHARGSPTATSARRPSCRSRRRRSSRRSRSPRPATSATTWCSRTRSTCSWRPGPS